MSDEGYVFEWPLWGLQLDAATGTTNEEFIVDGTLLYQPTWQQWRDTENGDVVEEHADREVAAERLRMPIYSRPPICMLRLSSIDGSGKPTRPPSSRKSRLVRWWPLFDSTRPATSSIQMM